MPLSFDVCSEDEICEDHMEFYVWPFRKHQEKEQFPMIRFFPSFNDSFFLLSEKPDGILSKVCDKAAIQWFTNRTIIEFCLRAPWNNWTTPKQGVILTPMKPNKS